MTLVLLMIALCGQTPDILDPASGAFLDEAGSADLLFYRADSAYRETEFAMAAEFYLEALRFRPGDSGSIYNLACCYGLMGEEELAAVTLRRAWAAGFDDIEHIQWDPDFDTVRSGLLFTSLVDSLKAVAEESRLALGEDITFMATGPFHCLVRTPHRWDGTEPLPLVLGIHGLGDSPEAFIGLWEVVGEYRCIFAVPQAPTPFLVGDRIGYTWFDGDWEDGSWTESATASRDYILTLLDDLEARYPVSEVLLFGYSQGGGMTYMTGFHAPERFTALAPFSGWLEESVITADELTEASGIPVRITHGEQDRMVEYRSALYADSVLSARGYDVELTTFQGEHMFSREALNAFLQEFLGGE